MKLLLDTHTFIWWDSDPSKLSSAALALCQDRSNALTLSVASVWEMQIKLQLGKLKLTLPLVDIIEAQRRVNNLKLLPIMLEHVLELENVPLHHKDPFDRLLIAQGIVEGAPIVTNDPEFAKYPAKVLW